MGFGASGLELQPQAPNLRDTLHRRSKPGTANTPKRRDKTIQSCHKDRERERERQTSLVPAVQHSRCASQEAGSVLAWA